MFRSPSRLAPLAVAGASAAACTLLVLVDPNQPGVYPTCPFLALTGRWCPGCGSLRGLRALLTGAPGAALGLNALMVLALPYLAYSSLAWASPLLGGPRLRPVQLSARATWAVLGVVLVFWLARNLPWAPFVALAP